MEEQAINNIYLRFEKSHSRLNFGTYNQQCTNCYMCGITTGSVKNEEMMLVLNFQCYFSKIIINDFLQECFSVLQSRYEKEFLEIVINRISKKMD